MDTSAGRCGALTLAIALIARMAAAQETPEEPALAWSAPAECPTQDDVRRAVEDAAGRPVEGGVRVRAAVTRLGADRFRLELETTGPEGVGHRVLEGPTCQELADAVAVIVSLAIESGSPEEDGTATGGAPPAPALAAAPARSPARPVAGERPPRAARGRRDDREAALHAEVRGWVGVDVGTLPQPAAGVGVGTSFGARGLRVDVAVTYFFDRRATPDGASASGADVGLIEASLGACRAFGLGARWELRFCGAVHAGLLRAAAFGVEGARSAETGWAAASADGSLWWIPPGPISFFVGVGALAPFLRPLFVLGSGQELHRPEAVSARFSLGPVFCWR